MSAQSWLLRFRRFMIKKSYYISQLKLNTRIYLKSPAPKAFKNGTLKTHTKYIQLDMALMTNFTLDETIELHKAWSHAKAASTCHPPSLNR